MLNKLLKFTVLANEFACIILTSICYIESEFIYFSPAMAQCFHVDFTRITSITNDD